MSHDRGCYCGLEPFEFYACQRSDCQRRGRAIENRRVQLEQLRAEADLPPKPKIVDRTDPEGGIPGRTEPTTTRIMPNRERPATRIVSVKNPGYDVLLFMHRDGSAHAIISKPGDAEPTTVLIGAPEPGRCIAVERRGSTFDVVYKDVQS